MKKYKYSFLSLVIFVIVSLAACAQEPDSVDRHNETKEKEDQYGGELIVDLASDPVSLDPHAANDGNSLYVMNTMYDTLVALDKDLNIEPALAESIEQIEDKVWEVKIRKDVEFHDGSELNADVVKANLDRVLDPEIGSSLAYLFVMI